MPRLGKIETSVATHFIENDFLHIIFKKDADIELEDMLESKNARLILQEGKPLKVFVDARSIYRLSKEARSASSSNENSELSIAMAILTKSLATKLLVNFFINYNKPSSPTKMFSSKEKALKWLNSF